MIERSTGVILRKLMHEWGLRESELARTIKIPQTTLNRLLVAHTSDPRVNTLRPLARHFGVTLGQLLGEEPLPEVFNRQSSNETGRMTWSIIPLLEWNAITDWINPAKEEEMIERQKIWLNTERRVGPKSFALKSLPFMEPDFRSGSVLVVDHGDACEDGAYVIVSVEGHYPTVRTVFRDGPDVYFKALEPGLPMTPKDERHQILGTVVEARLDFLKS